MIKTIIRTALLAGTLDITAACLQAYTMAGMMPEKLLRYIASGVFGKAAFEEGNSMIVWGLLFHFIIAFSCTIIFFWLYPKISFLKHKLLINSLLIAIIAWAITNWVIIPTSLIPNRTFNLIKAVMAIAILFVCIGLPISYNAQRYFANKINNQPNQ